MRVRHFSLLAILFSPCALYAQATLYADPSKRFTIHVPEGWTTEDTGDPGLYMTGSGLVWTVSPLIGTDGNGALTNMVDRVNGAWKDLKEFDRQVTSIGGQASTWVVFEGTMRDGKPGIVRAIGIQGGGVTAGIIISGEHASYNAARGTIEATLATLRLGANPPLVIGGPAGGGATSNPASPASPASPATSAAPPSIGLTVRDIDTDDVRLLGLDDETGALVDEVVPGGPADQAKIQPTDVILQIDRTPVTNAAEFERRLSGHKPGDTVDLLVTRHGRNKTVSVRVEAAK
jgi:hypothetical protein